MIVQSSFYFSATTILGGAVDLSFKVPGTFSGITPTDAAQGRFFKCMNIWADAPNVADRISVISVNDVDSVVPAPARPLLPTWPDVLPLFTQAEADIGLTNGFWIKDVLSITPFDSAGNPSVHFIPSGLYLKATITAGGLGIGRVFRGNIIWGRYVA